MCQMQTVPIQMAKAKQLDYIFVSMLYSYSKESNFAGTTRGETEWFPISMQFDTNLLG